MKLRKSLWLLVYTCSKSHWTNPWDNNPYRGIKHETPLLSQRVSKTQTAREEKKKEKSILLPCSSFPCICSPQQDVRVDLLWSDWFYVFIYFSYVLQKKFPHRITQLARCMSRVQDIKTHTHAHTYLRTTGSP